MLGVQTQSEIMGQGTLCVRAWSAHHLPHPFLIPKITPGTKNIPKNKGKAKASRCDVPPGQASFCRAQQSKSEDIFRGLSMPGVFYECGSLFTMMMLVKTIGYAQQIFRRPDMNIDLLCSLGIGMSKTGGNKLDGDTFCVKRCCEIMPQSMRSESRYPGVPGKFFTQTV